MMANFTMVVIFLVFVLFSCIIPIFIDVKYFKLYVDVFYTIVFILGIALVIFKIFN